MKIIYTPEEAERRRQEDKDIVEVFHTSRKRVSPRCLSLTEGRCIIDQSIRVEPAPRARSVRIAGTVHTRLDDSC